MRELRAALALAAVLVIGLPAAASGHTRDASAVWPQFEPAFSTAADDPLALDIARAVARDPDQVTGASWVQVPPAGPADGVATTAAGSFPVHGGSYGMLTTGRVADAFKQPQSTSASTSFGSSAPAYGNARDLSILKIDLAVPDAANCLWVRFAFHTEEYPEFVDSQFNDGFIAELDSTTWTVSGRTITAPGNFAFDPAGKVISVNAAGFSGLTAANAAGTVYDGGSALLAAAVPVTPGAHSAYFSIFDNADTIYDSAVMLDDLVLDTVGPGGCTAGARAQPPTGALEVTKAADADTVGPGGADGYTITLTNRGASDVSVASIADTLPAGFSYSGPTHGATTTAPALDGQTLTWNGPFTVPGGESVSLHFIVKAAGAPGEYLNTAAALDAAGGTIAASGPTARIVVDGGHAPVAANQEATTLMDVPVPVRLGATDEDGDTLDFTVVTAPDPTAGTLSGTGRDLTFTPAPGFLGDASFTFRAHDGTNASNLATVTVHVVDACAQGAAEPGGVFISGQDADAHAVAGEFNKDGAIEIVRRAIGWTTHGKADPSVLLIATSADMLPPGGRLDVDPRVALANAGVEHFDVAHANASGPGALDLGTVAFGGYDAVVVASAPGGWFTPADSEALNARAADVLRFVNGGGGLVAFSETGLRRPFGFLPFVVSALPSDFVESGVTLTPLGRGMGLDEADVNGNVSHNVFRSTATLGLVNADASGRYLSLATRGRRLDVDGVCASARVRNGHFERPVIPDGAGYQSHEGTGIEHWHVDGRVDLTSSELWAAAEGRQSVDLNELAPARIWQDVATQAGAGYDLTFSLAVNADPTCVGADVREMAVLWNGTEVARHQVERAGRTPQDPGWQDRQVRVHATAATSRLAFESLTSGACGPAIDFVRLEPVELVRPKLTVLRTGNGHGTVETVADASIACGDTCEASYDPGTVVELRAVADEGSRFIGWRRACTGQACAPTVNADTTVEAVFAGAGPLTWSLARDYRVSFDGPAANPIPDGSGISGVWRLGYSDAAADLDTVRSPSAYHAFEQRGAAGDVLRWGHNGWDASFAMGDTPSASQYPHAVVATPPADRVLVASWTSPITGHVRVSGGITDTDGSAGDGARWFVTKGAAELARGAIANGGCETQGFLYGTGGDSLADIEVTPGDTLHFVLDPRSGATADATALDINIAEIDPGTAGPPVRDRWEIASDFRWDPILQNPNFDAYGHLCAWTFEARRGDPPVTSKLATTTTMLTGLPLLHAWMGEAQGGFGAFHPLVAMNTGAEAFHLNFRIPSRTFLVHPAADGGPAILRWRSPFRGHVKVTGAATHLDHNGGDGVTWSIEHGADTLDQGSAFQGTSAFDDPALESRAVEKGDLLHFVVGPSGGYDYDTTQLDVVIERVPAPRRTLKVIRDPEGGGQVTSADVPKTIDCGATCEASYPDGTEVTLTATPGAGWDFIKWAGGGCSGNKHCAVEMTAARTVTAVFERQKHPLTVEVRSVQAGAGSVDSADGRIDCSLQCEAAYDHGDVVTLRHHAVPGSRFTGWSGCGSLPGGPAGDCLVTMDAAKTVIASFVKRVRLNLLVEGSGSVTAAPGFTDCAAACEAEYDRGTVVTLDARPQAGWAFAGWDGVACIQPLGCNAAMDADQRVTARFRRIDPPQTLVVDVTPRGGGTVTSDLPAVDGCAAFCSATVPYGTIVNLHAQPLPGYRFKRMSSSACATPDLPDCRLEMTAGRAVTVEFERLPGSAYTLLLGVSGQKGSVLVTPPGTRCLSSTITWSTTFCKYQIAEGTTMVLEARPEAGYRFADWKLGPCQYLRKPGTKEPQPRCEFVMSTALIPKGGTGLNVDATFEPLKLPKPAVGQTAISKPLAGVVTYQPPAVTGSVAAGAASVAGDVPFVRIDGRQIVPIGSVIDATRGALRLTVRNARGRLQAIDAAGGMFAFRQARKGSGRGRTTLELTTTEPDPCADRKRLVQTLRTSSTGPLFVRTRFAEAFGRHGRWTTEDRCDRTVTKVAKGTVMVRPLRGKRAVRVRAGRRASTRQP